MNGDLLRHTEKSLLPIDHQTRSLHRSRLDRAQTVLQRVVLPLQYPFSGYEDDASASKNGCRLQRLIIAPGEARSPSTTYRKPLSCGKVMDLATMATSLMASTIKKTSHCLLSELHRAKVLQDNSTLQISRT